MRITESSKSLLAYQKTNWEKEKTLPPKRRQGPD